MIEFGRFILFDNIVYFMTSDRAVSPITGVTFMIFISVIVFGVFGYLPFGMHEELVVTRDNIDFEECVDGKVEVTVTEDPDNFKVELYDDSKFVREVTREGSFLVDVSESEAYLSMVVSNSDGKRVFTERFGYSC
jgi:hypothetical protein